MIQAALGHTHKFATTWTADNNGHWYACAGCSEKGSYAAHTWNGNSCSLCGISNPNATQPTNPTEPSTEHSGNSAKPNTPNTESSTNPTESTTEPSFGSTEPSANITTPPALTEQKPDGKDAGANTIWVVLSVIGIICFVCGITAGVVIAKKSNKAPEN